MPIDVRADYVSIALRNGKRPQMLSNCSAPRNAGTEREMGLTFLSQLILVVECPTQIYGLTSLFYNTCSIGAKRFNSNQ
jgi:hypothetical protein